MGSVHGRFQPPHNDHLEYILAAKRRCDHLLVGVTRYHRIDVTVSLGSRHRDFLSANPLSYYERSVIIRLMLEDNGLSESEFSITPFPIESPDLLPEFVPRSAVAFTTICDEWNREKIRRLERCGYQVIVLFERAEKKISGKLIREAIKLDSASWASMVPTVVRREIERLNVRQRLIGLSSTALELGESAMTGTRRFNEEELTREFLLACEGRTFVTFRELSKRLGVSVGELLTIKPILEAHLKSKEPDVSLTSRMDLDPPGFEIRE